MRVLILHSRYLSGSVSGENRAVEDDVRLLREAGHAVTLLASEPSPEGAIARMRLGMEAVWSAGAVADVRRLIARHRPEVVHVHNLFPTLSPAVIRVSAEVAPVVMTLHNYRLTCLPGTLFRDGRPCEDCVGRVPWRGVVHRCFRGSAAASSSLAASIALHRAIGSFERIGLFLAVSGFVKGLHARAGLDASKIAVRPNFSWPTPARDGPGLHFLYVGRLSVEKGVRTMLHAWRDVDADLVVAGAGPLADEVRRSTRSNVRLWGPLEPAGVTEAMRSARAVVAPSLWPEPGSRVVVEAAAAGVPAIASRTGGLEEVVRHERSGLLARPNDPSALAGAAHRLRDDGESLRLGQGATEVWRERLSPEAALTSLERAYSEVMAG